MSVAGRDGVDKLAKDAFIISIFCAKKFPRNSLPKDLRAITNVNSFKVHIKTYLSKTL